MTIANILTITQVFWVIVLQIPLLKTHQIRRSNSRPVESIPTTTELCLVTIIFWIIQFLFQSTLTVLIFYFFYQPLRTNLEEWRDTVATDILLKLMRMFSATWGVHLVLVTLLDFVLPSLHTLYFHPEANILHLRSRYRTLIKFLWLLVLNSSGDKISAQLAKPSAPRQRKGASLALHNANGTCNDVRLERSRAQIMVKGHRALDWNLAIDSAAMNEMKETLGPPGGFGELGFCVQKDGVKFECMGPGTNFSLTFKLESGEEKPSGNINIGRPRKKKR